MPDLVSSPRRHDDLGPGVSRPVQLDATFEAYLDNFDINFRNIPVVETQPVYRPRPFPTHDPLDLIAHHVREFRDLIDGLSRPRRSAGLAPSARRRLNFGPRSTSAPSLDLYNQPHENWEVDSSVSYNSSPDPRLFTPRRAPAYYSDFRGPTSEEDESLDELQLSLTPSAVASSIGAHSSDWEDIYGAPAPDSVAGSDAEDREAFLRLFDDEIFILIGSITDNNKGPKGERSS